MYKDGGWGFGNFDELPNPSLPALETTLSELNFSKSTLSELIFFQNHLSTYPGYSFRIFKFDNQSINMI